MVQPFLTFADAADLVMVLPGMPDDKRAPLAHSLRLFTGHVFSCGGAKATGSGSRTEEDDTYDGPDFRSFSPVVSGSSRFSPMNDPLSLDSGAAAGGAGGPSDWTRLSTEVYDPRSLDSGAAAGGAGGAGGSSSFDSGSAAGGAGGAGPREYSPTSPSHNPAGGAGGSTSRKTVSFSNVGNSRAQGMLDPSYNPTSRAYSPTSPSYNPTSPSYCSLDPTGKAGDAAFFENLSLRQGQRQPTPVPAPAAPVDEDNADENDSNDSGEDSAGASTPTVARANEVSTAGNDEEMEEAEDRQVMINSTLLRNREPLGPNAEQQEDQAMDVPAPGPRGPVRAVPVPPHWANEDEEDDQAPAPAPAAAVEEEEEDDQAPAPAPSAAVEVNQAPAPAPAAAVEVNQAPAPAPAAAEEEDGGLWLPSGDGGQGGDSPQVGRKRARDEDEDDPTAAIRYQQALMEQGIRLANATNLDDDLREALKKNLLDLARRGV